jgi:hypothetical protein
VGITSLEWDGRENNCIQADDRLKSFVFALKNPHNAQRNNAGCGPHFHDIVVLDHYNGYNNSSTFLEASYPDDTGMENAFLVGSNHFQVKEIEVFEIRNRTTLHAQILVAYAWTVRDRRGSAELCFGFVNNSFQKKA